ncbi:MAG: FkbM family methyltransferase [Chitinophagaceae bacterium]|jgi:FkbM family methyltransferase|nr:FkbM family methyltransferase [Chitinophagaceae bacterium]
MQLIFKIFDSLKVIISSKRPIASYFKKGSSIASTQIIHSMKKYVPELNTILDVGANQGQFAITSTFFYPAATIHSFEPVPDTYKLLEANTKNNASIKCNNYALGSNTGEIDFFSNDHSHASSALPVSEHQKNAIPLTARQHKIKVAVKTLDDIGNSLAIQSPILLKLDVQGFEKEVLKGAINFIQKVDYVLFEASFVSMYDGEALFDEMHTILKNMGFELIGPVGFLQTNDLQILQMDMLYKRKDK